MALGRPASVCLLEPGRLELVELAALAHEAKQQLELLNRVALVEPLRIGGVLDVEALTISCARGASSTSTRRRSAPSRTRRA